MEWTRTLPVILLACGLLSCRQPEAGSDVKSNPPSNKPASAREPGTAAQAPGAASDPARAKATASVAEAVGSERDDARQAGTPPEDVLRERFFARRSVTYARHGMVAAAHPLAVQLGLDILKQGGNAVDAAIGVNAALGLLEPTSCGIGGDLFALVWDAKGKRLHGLNGSGRSPAALRIDLVKPRPDGTISYRDPVAWSVPGAVDAWFTLHKRFGRLPMKRILAGPIQLAKDGAPVPRKIAYYWKRGGELLKDMPGFAETFLPGGRAPTEGEVFRNPRLARSYERIAQAGRDAYYRGPIAKAIVAMSKAHGGFFSLQDFASHRSEWVEPLSTTYRGVRVWELPPNGQGLAALQMLNILENFDLKGMGRASADFWHILVEAKKLAFADRAKFYADPDFAKIPIEWLLSKDYGRKRAQQIDMKRAASTVSPGPSRLGQAHLEHGDTTYLCVADAQGNMVSLIQSNYTGFGSGHAVEGFGLQNRGALFSLDPASANALEPKKRPFHTIIPGFATRDGQPWLAFGVMGGSMQPQGHVQILLNLIDFGLDLQQAGDAPRFRHEGSSQPTGTKMLDGGKLTLEEGVPSAIRRELVRRGHRLAPSGSYGGYQAILVTGANEQRVYAGATESRKDGLAAGF